MKKYSIYLKIKPGVTSMSAEEINKINMMNEITGIFLSDMNEEEKKKAITKTNDRYLAKKNETISNLRIFKKDFEIMQYFYAFNSINRRQKFAVDTDMIIPTFFSASDSDMIDLPYFMDFSEKIGREISVNGERMIAICKLEDQFIICKQGRFGVLVDDGSKMIQYKGKVNFSPKANDIQDSIIDFIEFERGKSPLRKKLNKKEV